MPTGTFILTEGDDADEPASSNVVFLNRLELGDPVSIGDLAALVVADAAVRLRGNFQLPRIVALTAWED